MDTPLGNGLFVFILGILVVFAGMLIIVLSVMACGKLISKSQEKAKNVKIEPVQQPIVQTANNDIPPHIKAAIVAVISAYYFESKSSCDFVVKKIKRI